MSWGERQLSVDERVRLCDAFLQLPGMRDRANRDLYIEELGGLPCRRYADAFHDVWAMLTTCLEEPPALRDLMKVVHALHGDSKPMLRLRTLVEHMFPPELIESEERAELLRMLAGIDHRFLSMAYRHASPAAWWRSSLDWGDADALVRHLETCTSGAGSAYPLLAFVDCVAHQLDSGRLAGHRWLDRVGGRLGIPEDGMARLCRSSSVWLATATEPCFVVVELQPDRIDPARFLLSISLQHHRSASEPLHRDDVARTIGEVPAVLSALLREISADDVTIEFIVPLGLLGYPIDQWLIDEKFPHRIGTAYPVVVRSLDRMRRKDLHANWRRKWRWLSENVHEPVERATSWIRAGDDPDVLYPTLLVDHVPVAVGLSYSPEHSDEFGTDSLTAALYAGVPVVFWCRDSELAQRFEEQMSAALAGRGLADVPAQVLRLRRQRDADPCLAEHVTLLWDDADRIPESFTRTARLRAPR